ncbi:GNAT family N-acetyltransferase [bacterium]|nr:GNAT family N-acetyltransferase [bacterium]
MEVEIRRHWNEQLESFAPLQKDIYFTEEYVKLYEAGAEAACFICKDGEKVILLPFLSRTFSFGGETYKDFETAYGYGGPICNCEDEAFLNKALGLFKDYCKAKGYVAGFVRFHPLLQNQIGFNLIGQVLAERKTVVMNLAQTIVDVWENEIHSKNRNAIRKAEKAGCRFIVDDKYEHLQDFIRLYDATMDKLSANEFYYFDDAYYTSLVKGVPDSFLGCVEDAEGKIISAAIFMYSGPYGHYHLSGSDKSQLALSPNNFMLWNAAVELQKRGVKRFHLGGGINNDEANSLFLFKKRFSKDTCQFYIGKLVFNEAVYDAICKAWEQRTPEKAERYRHHLLKYKY